MLEIGTYLAHWNSATKRVTKIISWLIKKERNEQQSELITIKNNKIENIEGLGKTVEKNILKSIKFAKSSDNRFLLGTALDIAENIKAKLIDLKDVNKIDIAGSLRRRKETIGDIDILAASINPSKVIDFFSNLKNVKQILAKGPTKSSVRVEEGMQVDLRVMPKNIYGAALLYFTGSQQHNIFLRKLAIKKKMKLSEYGVFDKKTNRLLAGNTEEDCYKRLGLQYIEPEIRENEGEIGLAQKNNPQETALRWWYDYSLFFLQPILSLK